MPDYTDLGLSEPMGAVLRANVEAQLRNDLHNYGFMGSSVKFDWSGSCIEGHDATHLGGYLENYSGILLFDINDNYLAEGWMDFILEPDFFLVYWDHLEVANPGSATGKLKFGIPSHIWQKIPDPFLHTYDRYRL